MVIHVGIDPFEGCAILFYSSSKTVKKIKFNEVKENEIHKVKEMFDQIKLNITDSLGYVCLCLFLDYGNEIRQAFIKSGISAGFKNVEIIDWFAAGYLIAISQAATYKPKNTEVIWIFNDNIFYIWQITSKKAKHLSFHHVELNETFEAMKSKASVKKNPNVILYNNKADKIFFDNIPSTCKLFPYEFQALEVAALIKARISANDSEVMSYDVFNILAQDITIMIDEVEIFTIKLHETLPLVKQMAIKKRPGQNNLKVIQNNKVVETVNLPTTDEFILEIKIDTNGIYQIKLLPMNFMGSKTLATKVSYYVGVDLLRGEISIFNAKTEQKNTTLLPFNISVSNMTQKIELILQEINKQIKVDKNCILAFHIDDDCFNSVLFDCINNCQIQNFRNFLFISTQTAEILNILNEYSLEESIKTIAFISDRIEKRKLYCQIWKRTNNLFRAEKSYFRDSSAGDDEVNLKKLCFESNGLNDIQKIFFDSLIDRNVFDKVFNKKLDLISIEYKPSYTEAALLYAKMNADIKKSSKSFMIENCLNRRFSFTVDEKTIFNEQMGKSLPFSKELKFNEIPVKTFKICERNASGRKFDSEYNFSCAKNCVFNLNCNIYGIITISVISENSPNSSDLHISKINPISEIDKKLMLLSKSFGNDVEALMESEKIKYTFPKKVKINNDEIYAVGIDLGTSRCCVGVNRKNGITTVPLDNTGERLLPSYVAFDEEYVKCGRIVVERLRNHAKSTVFDVKRIIGKNFEDIKVDGCWPFTVIDGKSLDVQRSWRTKVLEQNEVFIETVTKGQKILKTPEVVSSELLKYLKLKAEQFQGKKLSETVITIPATFSKNQKIATYVAALLAGWTTVNLLPEPVAASFAYFIDRELPSNSLMLLFDLGGGTLDVCVFKIKNDELRIVSRSGNENVGGRNFDNLLINYFEKKLYDEYKIQLPKAKKYKLMLDCQNVKENLSVGNEDLLDVEDYDSLNTGLINVTREQFENMATLLLATIKSTILEAVVKSQYDTKMIDKVLFVGGGSRMPMIKELLRSIFPKAEHCCEEHPDEVVAIGAAYYAYSLKTNKETKNQCSLM